MERELGRNIMIKFVELRAKNYSYLIDDDIVKIKKKKTQKCVSQKENLNLKKCKNCLKANQLENNIKKFMILL